MIEVDLVGCVLDEEFSVDVVGKLAPFIQGLDGSVSLHRLPEQKVLLRVLLVQKVLQRYLQSPPPTIIESRVVVASGQFGFCQTLTQSLLSISPSNFYFTTACEKRFIAYKRA